MRIIDADALQRRICGAKCGCEYEDCGNEGDCGYDHFISTALTIDAVPVVRCRECIAYTPVDDNTGKRVFLIGKHQYVVPDGYCYLGERKEGADNG